MVTRSLAVTRFDYVGNAECRRRSPAFWQKRALWRSPAFWRSLALYIAVTRFDCVSTHKLNKHGECHRECGMPQGMRKTARKAERRRECGIPQGMRNAAGNAGNAECGMPQGMRNAAGNALVVSGYINEYPCGMPQVMLNAARNAENRRESGIQLPQTDMFCLTSRHHRHAPSQSKFLYAPTIHGRSVR